MKRFLALALALVLCLTILPSFAEDVQDDNSQPDPDVAEIALTEDTYTAWLDLSWPIVYSYYCKSTWLNEDYFYSGYSSNKKYYDLSYMLLEDPLTATAEQAKAAGELYTYLKDNYYVSKYTSGGREFVAANAYSVLNKMPPVLNALLALHDKVTVPAEYKAIDGMMIATINNLLNVSTKFRQQIESVGTAEGWRSPLNRNNPDSIYGLFQIMK